MANETTATTVTELIRTEAIGAGALYFAERPGVSSFVARQDLTGEPTLAAVFPIYDKVSATAISENADFTTNSAVDTSGSVTATVTEHAIKFTVTDRSLDATVEEMLGQPSARLKAKAEASGGRVGTMLAEALQRRQDQDITALFSAFNSSTGSNSGPLTTTLLIDGITTLNINDVPTDRRVVVLHSRQWQALLPSFDDANVFGAQGQQIINTGAVGTLYGALIFETNNVTTATVTSSTVYAGAVMHPSAIGLATKGAMPSVETERDASLRATEVVGTGSWGEVEWRGQATTSGRGGAGIYLYSNTTN